jgi:ABC-type branched-subunit amino acid transport system substrate-binding protein
VKNAKWLVVVLTVGLVAVGCGKSSKVGSTGNGSTSTTAVAASAKCATPLQATDVGVTDKDITIQVMADVGSPLAPGLFQGNVDAVNAFAKYWNANGGIGCRQVKVVVWDSKLNAEESKNGLINACASALAMVGDNALFNPDMAPAETCKDKAGATTGVPDLTGLANDIHEQCSKLDYTMQGLSYPCPLQTGTQDLKAMAAVQKYYVDNVAKGTPLHGMFMVPGDLPTTVQSATPLVAAQEAAGIKFDDVLKGSGRDQQAAFTPRVQALKQHGGNYVYAGGNDRSMINMRKETKAQGVDQQVKVWACSLACYTKAFVSNGGPDVDGTYAWMQFLPFEEKSSNPELARYMDSVGDDKVDAFGAQAWQAAVLFKQAVDKIVASDGPNAVTRANLLKTLDTINDFTANGWVGLKPLKGYSQCFVIVQLKAGKWQRVYPTQAGTFDCKDGNVVTVHLDPVAEAAKIK